MLLFFFDTMYVLVDFKEFCQGLKMINSTVLTQKQKERIFALMAFRRLKKRDRVYWYDFYTSIVSTSSRYYDLDITKMDYPLHAIFGTIKNSTNEAYLKWQNQKDVGWPDRCKITMKSIFSGKFECLHRVVKMYSFCVGYGHFVNQLAKPLNSTIYMVIVRCLILFDTLNDEPNDNDNDTNKQNKDKCESKNRFVNGKYISKRRSTIVKEEIINQQVLNNPVSLFHTHDEIETCNEEKDTREEEKDEKKDEKKDKKQDEKQNQMSALDTSIRDFSWSRNFIEPMKGFVMSLFFDLLNDPGFVLVYIFYVYYHIDILSNITMIIFIVCETLFCIGTCMIVTNC